MPKTPSLPTGGPAELDGTIWESIDISPTGSKSCRRKPKKKLKPNKKPKTYF